VRTVTNDCRLYVNGVELGGADGLPPTTLEGSDPLLHVGGASYDGEPLIGALRGVMSGLRYTPRAKTAEEILITWESIAADVAAANGAGEPATAARPVVIILT
jgi:hypothetical protein